MRYQDLSSYMTQRDHRHRGPPLLRELGRRRARHRPRPRAGRAQPQGGAGRIDHRPAVRQERPARAVATAPCSRRCARRRWPTTSRASGPRARSSREYLNSIYFGNGAYGVESAARTYFGNQPDHKDCGTRANLCVKQLKPDEAALIAGVVANPTAYDPVAHPAGGPGAAQPRAQGHVRPGPAAARASTATPASRPLPAPIDIKPPDREDHRRRTSRPGSASSSSTSSAPARRSRAGSRCTRRSTSTSRTRPSRRSTSTWPIPAGPSAAARGDRQQDRRGARDGRRARLRDAPVQPRHPGPAPARLVDQAVHPRRGAEEGLRGRLAVAVAQARLHRPGHPRQGEVRRQQLREQVRGLADARRRPDATPTTRSSRRWASPSGTKKIAALAERMGIRTPVSSNYAMTLGGLKQGVTPLDMAHAYETFIEGGRRIGGTLGAERRRPRRDPRRSTRRTASRSSRTT